MLVLLGGVLAVFHSLWWCVVLGFPLLPYSWRHSRLVLDDNITQ